MCLELKMTIYMTPSAISQGGIVKTRKIYAGCKYRRGDAARVALGYPLDSIDTISFATMMKSV
jgi:hypothetical protein